MDNQLYQKLVDEIKSYLQVRYDLVRLSALEKMSKILGLVLVTFVVILLLIVGALVLVMIALVIIFREKWFINPIIGALSAILFADEQENEPNQPEQNTNYYE